MFTDVSSRPPVPSDVLDAARRANWWVQRRARCWGIEVSSAEGFAISLEHGWQGFSEGKNPFTCACTAAAYWARLERENGERVCQMPLGFEVSVDRDPSDIADFDAIEVRSLLDCLPSRQRELAVLLAEGYTQREIAAQWGISEPRVCQLKAVLRERLAEYLRR
jgi:RNA polymerase sigma factor (sigma-70 family)